MSNTVHRNPTPAEAVVQLRNFAFKHGGAEGDAIMILIDHVGELERMLSRIRADHEVVLRRPPDNAVHEVAPARRTKKA